MKTLMNVIWIIFGGLISCLGWLLCGVILCITIIGIPFGKQAFKCATLSLAPFGKKVNLQYSKHFIANTIWLIFFGWVIFISQFFAGLIMCITLIGIPFGLQIMKFAKLGLAPFGAEVK